MNPPENKAAIKAALERINRDIIVRCEELIAIASLVPPPSGGSYILSPGTGCFQVWDGGVITWGDFRYDQDSRPAIRCFSTSDPPEIQQAFIKVLPQLKREIRENARRVKRDARFDRRSVKKRKQMLVTALKNCRPTGVESFLVTRSKKFQLYLLCAWIIMLATVGHWAWNTLGK